MLYAAYQLGLSPSEVTFEVLKALESTVPPDTGCGETAGWLWYRSLSDKDPWYGEYDRLDLLWGRYAFSNAADDA